jgi:hypothetical protein
MPLVLAFVVPLFVMLLPLLARLDGSGFGFYGGVN